MKKLWISLVVATMLCGLFASVAVGGSGTGPDRPLSLESEEDLPARVHDCAGKRGPAGFQALGSYSLGDCDGAPTDCI